MKFTFLSLTNITIVIVLLSLVGCASKNSVQLKHMSAIQDWKHTVNRTNTLLLKHNKIHFSAQLIVQYTPSGDEFTLDGFSIGKQLTENSIDLLNPHFSKVKACSWKCYYLGDIVDNSFFPAQTYLTRFYNVNKDQLSQFYDIINRVSLSILNHSSKNQTTFINYIMAEKDRRFENLAAIRDFIMDAYNKSVPNEKSLTVENQHQADLANSKLRFIQSPIGRNYTRDIENKTTSPVEPKNSDINTFELLQTVCSIKENNFGKVTAVDGDDVTVHLKGQVKINKDGIYTIPSPGFLLDSLTAFTYEDIDQVKVFAKGDLFTCDIGEVE